MRNVFTLSRLKIEKHNRTSSLGGSGGHLVYNRIRKWNCPMAQEKKCHKNRFSEDTRNLVWVSQWPILMQNLTLLLWNQQNSHSYLYLALASPMTFLCCLVEFVSNFANVRSSSAKSVNDMLTSLIIQQMYKRGPFEVGKW